MPLRVTLIKIACWLPGNQCSESCVASSQTGFIKSKRQEKKKLVLLTPSVLPERLMTCDKSGDYSAILLQKIVGRLHVKGIKFVLKCTKRKLTHIFLNLTHRGHVYRCIASSHPFKIFTKHLGTEVNS